MAPMRTPIWRACSGEELSVVETEAGYAVSFDGTPLAGRFAPAFFSEASKNPGGLDHFVEGGTAGWIRPVGGG